MKCLNWSTVQALLAASSDDDYWSTMVVVTLKLVSYPSSQHWIPSSNLISIHIINKTTIANWQAAELQHSRYTQPDKSHCVCWPTYVRRHVGDIHNWSVNPTLHQSPIHQYLMFHWYIKSIVSIWIPRKVEGNCVHWVQGRNEAQTCLDGALRSCVFPRLIQMQAELAVRVRWSWVVHSIGDQLLLHLPRLSSLQSHLGRCLRNNLLEVTVVWE